jgi:sulfatase maturation enzyme AslB (radical SAM superfamily)
VTGKDGSILEQFDQHIDCLEQIYFAGGEPLIMREHYVLLDKLLAAGRTDVKLQYNTNFSELQFKDKHVFEYWSQFRDVRVGASLDGMGKHAELVRKGTQWDQIEKNRSLMMELVPHVKFSVNCTVSSLNVLHALEFHKDWVSRGFILPDDWNVNICQSPEWYRADIFPKWFKDTYIVPA